MPDYRIRILVDAEDRASGPLGNVGAALGNIAQIGIGNLLAQGVGALAGGIASAGKEALDAVMGYERMSSSLESLLAKEIRNASGVEKTISLGKERIELTAKELAQLAKLQDSLGDATLARDTLNAKIQEQHERIRQLTERYGENGLVVIKERAELAQMENQLAKTGDAIAKYGSQIDALQAKNGKLVDITQKVVEGQLSMTEALELAGPKAAELLQWTEKLAILSPFTSEDVANSLRTFMNFNMGSEMAKRLTEDLVDLSAASGKTGDTMRLIAYALGQIGLSDKLLMQDLRQLINAGVDVETVLNKMGYSLKDVGDKAIDSQKFIQVFAETMEEDFGGAAERMAESLPGLISSLEEIKDLALRDVFTGMFDAAKPALAELVNLATSPEFRTGLQGFGKGLGEGLASSIAFIRTTVLPTLALLVGWFQTQGLPAIQNFANAAGPQLGAGLMLLVSWIQQVAGFALPLLGQAFGFVLDRMDVFGPVLGGIAVALGVILAPLVGIPAALVVLATAWANNWGGIQEKTAAVWAFLQPILAGIGTLLLERVVPAIGQFAAWIQSTAIPALVRFGEWLGPLLVTAALGFVSWLQGTFLPALAQFAGWFQTTALPAVQGFAAQVIPLLQGAFGQVNAFVTTQALPALMRFADWFTVTALPAIQGFAGQVGPALQGAFATVGTFLTEQVLPRLNAFGDWFLGTALPKIQNFAGQIGPVLQSAFAAASTFITQTLLPKLNEFGNWFLGTALPKIQEFAGRVGPALEGAFANIGPFVEGVGGVIREFAGWVTGDLATALGTMVSEISTAAQPTLETFGGWIRDTFLPAVQELANVLGPILQGAFAGLGTAAGPNLRTVFAELGRFITESLIPTLTKIGVWIFETGLPAFGDLANKIGGHVNDAVREFAKLWGTITKHFESAVKFAGDLGGKLNEIADLINGAVGSAFRTFNDVILKPLKETLDGIVGLAESFFDWLGKIATALSNFQIPDFLQRHSPSPLEQALMGATEHLRTLLSLIPAVNFNKLRFGDFALLNLNAEKFARTLAGIRASMSKLGADPLKNWDDVKRQFAGAIDLFNTMKRSGIELPGEFRAGLDAVLGDLVNLGTLAPEVVKELKDKLGGATAVGGGGALALAGAGGLGGGAVTNDNRVVFNNYGNVYLAANNAREFFGSFDEFAERVDVEGRFIG